MHDLTNNVNVDSSDTAAGSAIMLFHLTSFQYNDEELLEELNSCVHQLANGKIGFIMCHFA